MNKLVKLLLFLVVFGLISPAWAEDEEPENLLPNPSVETVDPDNSNVPQHWVRNFWGDVDATFTYLETGHSGNRSLRVENTVDTAEGAGDCKWWTEAFDIVEGQTRYTLSNYYRSNTTTSLMIQAILDTDETRWISVASAPSTAEWTKLTAEIVLPEGTVQIRVLHVLASKGWLETDDFSVTEYTNPNVEGKKALVSIVFDDGWVSGFIHAIPVMNELGFAGTHFLHAEFIDKPGYQADYMTSKQIYEMAAEGHEFGSHCLHHVNLAEVSLEDAEKHLVESKKILEELGFNVPGLTPPGGAYNDEVMVKVKENYQYMRTIVSGLNYKPYDVYHLKCISVLNTTTLDDIKYYVQKAAAEDAWLILVYHRLGDPATLETFVTPDSFRADMEYLVEAEAEVLTMGEVLGVWEAQDWTPEEVEGGAVLPRPEITNAEYNPETEEWEPNPDSDHPAFSENDDGNDSGSGLEGSESNGCRLSGMDGGMALLLLLALPWVRRLKKCKICFFV